METRENRAEHQLAGFLRGRQGEDLAATFGVEHDAALLMPPFGAAGGAVDGDLGLAGLGCGVADAEPKPGARGGGAPDHGGVEHVDFVGPVEFRRLHEEPCGFVFAGTGEKEAEVDEVRESVVER